MVDLYGSSDLHHDLIKKTVQIRRLSHSPTKVDQDAHMPAHFFQVRSIWIAGFLLHQD
jgi:hypothetical protein